MNTKQDGISSGLVVVAWRTETGYEQPFYFYHEQKPARGKSDPLVRLSDAEAKLSECVTGYEKEVAGLTAELDAKDAEIERLNGECDRLAKAASKNYRDNGLPINEEFYKQAERIKELESDVDEEAYIRDRMAKLLAETAVALKGPEKALHRHGWQDLPEVAGKQSAALKLARAALLNDGYPCRTYCTCMACKALAAINEVLGE